jgi:hypothetical protein
MVMAKTADEARKAAMSKKPAAKSKGAPKGGGKGLSGDALVGKVSQSTINSIKKMGMTDALKLAGTNGKTSGGLAREFQEGVRRMYGADRLAAAKAKYGPTKPAAKSADAARLSVTKASVKMPGKGPATRIGTKKSETTDPFARAVFGAGGAIKRAVTGGSNQGMSAAQVAAENKRRAAAVAAAKAKKNK